MAEMEQSLETIFGEVKKNIIEVESKGVSGTRPDSTGYFDNLTKIIQIIVGDWTREEMTKVGACQWVDAWLKEIGMSRTWIEAHEGHLLWVDMCNPQQLQICLDRWGGHRMTISQGNLRSEGLGEAGLPARRNVERQSWRDVQVRVVDRDQGAQVRGHELPPRRNVERQSWWDVQVRVVDPDQGAQARGHE